MGQPRLSDKILRDLRDQHRTVAFDVEGNQHRVTWRVLQYCEAPFDLRARVYSGEAAAIRQWVAYVIVDLDDVRVLPLRLFVLPPALIAGMIRAVDQDGSDWARKTMWGRRPSSPANSVRSSRRWVAQISAVFQVNRVLRFAPGWPS